MSCLEQSMWGSRVTRECMLQKISLLALLGSIKEGETEHSLVSTSGPQRSITVQQEAEITSNLSFLSYRRKDSQTVTAISIEEDEDRQGMTIRVAVNGGAVAYIMDGLQQICAILEKASLHGRSENDDVDVLFRKVITLDFPRISARLQLGKRHSISSTHINKLYKAFYTKTAQETSSERTDLQLEIVSLFDLYRALKNRPSPQQNPRAYDIVTDIIKTAHFLNSSGGFNVAIRNSPVLDAKEKTNILDRMAKLGQYFKATAELVLAARRKRYRIFNKIRVQSFQMSVPDQIRAPSNPQSALPLIKALPKSEHISRMLRQSKDSQFKASAMLVQRLNNTRSSIKVHAEIKLLFYYESHPKSVKPRIICANRSACYLCDLFLKIHGEFQVPRTFGKLNERWILPDWLDTIPLERFPILKIAIEQFDNILDAQIRQLSQQQSKHPDPRESAIGLSAPWSVSSSEGSRSYHAYSAPIQDDPAQKSPEGLTSPLSFSNLISISESRPSKTEPVEVRSRPGKPRLRQSATHEWSFTIDFRSPHVTLCFDTVKLVEELSSWVEIGYLERETLPKSHCTNARLISVSDLPKDTNVEITIEDSPLCLHYNGQYVSILVGREFGGCDG